MRLALSHISLKAMQLARQAKAASYVNTMTLAVWRAPEVFGDGWAFLISRELMPGPRRYECHASFASPTNVFASPNRVRIQLVHAKLAGSRGSTDPHFLGALGK